MGKSSALHSELILMSVIPGLKLDLSHYVLYTMSQE
ncbi:hypothetical protein SAMN06295888_101428 [Desulfonatronum zhilinae]|nr:hypothetical protein SAMN06295888_101428 [Desulfonatronum zhilinae]